MNIIFELSSNTLETHNAKEAEVLSKNCQGCLGTDMPRHFSRKNIYSVSFLFILLVSRGRNGECYTVTGTPPH